MSNLRLQLCNYRLTTAEILYHLPDHPNVLQSFIWQNMVGGQHPMMDVVIGRMTRDPKLGLVFPDDPHLSDWDHNLPVAEQLARRMGMRLPLQPFFDFPVGTMFWARSAALAPLFRLGLTWDDYPQEPQGFLRDTARVSCPSCGHWRRRAARRVMGCGLPALHATPNPSILSRYDS